MKNPIIYSIVIAIAVLLLSNCKKEEEPAFVHDFGSFTDSRDGQVYKTIEIGTQTWFAENLAYEGAGEEITDFDGWFLSTTYEGWCYYENDKSTYGSTYGILYQWGVASIACPDGWHLPTRAEWIALSNYLGGTDIAGGKLKEAGTTHWHSINKGATNESGFTALPGGIKVNTAHYFDVIGYYGHFWGSESDSTSATNVSLTYYKYDFRGGDGNYSSFKYSGYSVRCLKD